MNSVSVFKAKQISAQIHCYEAGQAQKPGALENDRIYFILEGLARITVGRTTREYGTGTFIQVNAGIEHGIINIGDQKLVVFSSTGVTPKVSKSKKTA